MAESANIGVDGRTRPSPAHTAERVGNVDVVPEDAARANLYRLLAYFLTRPMQQPDLDAGAGLVSADAPDSSPLGQAVGGFAGACRAVDPVVAGDRYQTLFIGLGRGELVPYGSYYLTGFLQEKPLARLRADMGSLGIVRDPNVTEPEDHIASLMEIMAGLIDGAFGPQLTLPAQKMFYDAHIGSWAKHFFRDLEACADAAPYNALGTVGLCFLDIEDEAFRMV